MKRCPSCQRTFPDDSPAYCTTDGTRMIDEASPSYDPQKTILASAAPPPQQANPSPPPQYSNPAPPQNLPPQRQAWPPPQAQDWKGGNPPSSQGYAPMQSSSFSIAAIIVGGISGVLGGLLLASYLEAFQMGRETAFPMLLAAINTGTHALVLGLIAVFSGRQKGKPLAIVGLVLALFSLGFWIYLESQIGIFFR